jgi:hypothetical protein
MWKSRDTGAAFKLFLKIENIKSTHEEPHGLGAGNSTLSSLTQMLLNRLSLYMIVKVT